MITSSRYLANNPLVLEHSKSSSYTCRRAYRHYYTISVQRQRRPVQWWWCIGFALTRFQLSRYMIIISVFEYANVFDRFEWFEIVMNVTKHPPPTQTQQHPFHVIYAQMILCRCACCLRIVLIPRCASQYNTKLLEFRKVIVSLRQVYVCVFL